MRVLKGMASLLAVFMACFAFLISGCDVIEQADEVKERLEDLAEYELERAVEQEVEKRVVEKVEEVRKEKNLDLFKKREDAGRPGKLILWNKKEVTFSDLLNLTGISGIDRNKNAKRFSMEDISELEILGRDCNWLQLDQKRPAKKCRLRVKSKDSKEYQLSSASFRQSGEISKPGQCIFLGKKAGAKKASQKSMGLTRIKRIVFSDK